MVSFFNKVVFFIVAFIASVSANTGIFTSIAAHAAGYAVGGVAAHETERYLDHRNSSQSSSNVSGADYANKKTEHQISDAMPNPKITPGAINTRVTQENIQETICRVGYTKTIRPPYSYTERLKKESISQYQYSDRNVRDYEEDHLVSLEVGGSPDDATNLWAEPHYVSGGWGSFTKDQLENKLHKLICDGAITLRRAQYEESHDWISAYKKYVSPTPIEQ